MPGTRKVLTALAVSLATILVGWTMLIGAVVLIGGVVTVSLHDAEGPDLFVPIPAILVDAAASTGGWFLAASGDVVIEGLDAPVDLAEWGPAVRGLLEVIEGCPDVTFVEVEDGSDRVRIYKQGRYLRVEVSDGRDFDLRISLPARTATRSVARLIG